MTIKQETGDKREFSTGAKKQAAEGKGTPVLIPGDGLLELAKHFEDGAKLHGARNWEKGIPLSELINSLERHIQQEKLGYTDERHDRAIAWNALVYLTTKLRIKRYQLPRELNDLETLQSKLIIPDKLNEGAEKIQAHTINHSITFYCAHCNGSGVSDGGEGCTHCGGVGAKICSR